MARRGVWLTGGVLVVGFGLLRTVHGRLPTGLPEGSERPSPAAAISSSSPSQSPVVEVAEPDIKSAAPSSDDARAHAFRLPSGRAPALSCTAARAIVSQARSQLSHAPEPVDPRGLADSTADWLDPYGLWSVAPDSPVATAFDRRASAVLADLEGRSGGNCPAARALV